MKLYNALSQQVEPFEPSGDSVTIYVCGVTPYDTTHLGHAFTYVVFDVLIRYLEATGQPVRYVQNVTDIDDDILRKAGEEGIDWQALGNREIERFLRDLSVLNVRPPDVYPRASQEVEMILTITEDLLRKGIAYERNGSVYFRVQSDPEFGKLSRYDYGTMLATANERGNNPEDPNKENPLDFVLWQAAQPGEPTWESPWGAGRPGWHIECSAMSMRYLGPTIDIHGGGADLLFPHHECEIAQSEKFTGQIPFVRFWMHTAMVRMDGEKMSKSLGNMVFVRELVKHHEADAIRAYLLAHRYREAFEWDEREMEESSRRAARWRDAVAAIAEPGVAESPGQPGSSEGLRERFHQAMRNDLDTPSALRVLDALATAALETGEQGEEKAMARQALLELGRVLGFTFSARELEA